MRVSLNIKYDYVDSGILKDYIPTNIHADFLSTVLKGITEASNLKSHVAYGPYGSGKSYIGSILTGILSKKYDLEEITLIKTKFSKVDRSVEKLISNYYELDFKYIPIIINGYEGNLNSVLIEKIINALDIHNIAYKIPTLFHFVNETIMMWSQQYLMTYDKFLNLLKEKKLTVEEFKSGMKNQDSKMADWFIDVFPELTSGQKLQIPVESNSINVLKELCQLLHEKGLGIFIVYDEFGRYLQNLEIHQVNLFMQETQDLAELANNGVKNLSVLLISHKPVSNYFSSYPDNVRYEFAKIEKRFTSSEIKSDDSMFVSIASNYIKANRQYSAPKPSDELINNTFKYRLFNSYLSDLQIKTYILNDMYPMHPLSVYILPEISRVFGQNERTLFTYLKDQTIYGLNDKLTKESGFVYCDSLVDYFFENTVSLNEYEQKKFMLYCLNIEKVSRTFRKQKLIDIQRVLKFIFLWSITKKNNIIPVKKELISFALDMSDKEVERTLSTLENERIIRFNLITKEYEIYESSGYDIDEEIIRAKKVNKFNDTKLYGTLNKYHEYKYLYSEKYNVENDITRFAKVTYIKDITTFKDEFEFADLHFVISFNKNVKIPNVINGYMLDDKSEIFQYAERLFYIDFLMQQPLFYKNLVFFVELEYEKSILLTKIREVQKNILSMTKFEITDGEFKVFRNIQKMEKFISNKFESTYTKPIRITNEQINMFNISSPQLKALSRIVDFVIQEESVNIEEAIGKSSIMKLSYHSIVNNITNQKNYEELKKYLMNYLGNNPEGSFIDLLRIITGSPFGVRPPVAIIFLILILIDKWQDILFYKNNTYISSIEGEELFKKLLNEYYEEYFHSIFGEYSTVSYFNNLTYVYSEFDNLNRPYLEFLETLFNSTSEFIQNKSLSIRVCSSIYNWFINLPIITQQGEDLTFSDIQFLEIIKKMRITPRNALQELIEFAPDVVVVEHFKQVIESHFKNYTNKLEKQIRVQLGITDIDDFLSNHDKLEIKFNKVIKALYNKERIIDQFDKEIDEIDMKKWTKSSFIRLRNHIIDNYSEKQKESYLKILIGNDKERAVQPVTLSQKGEITQENIENIIDATSKYMTQNEVENIIINLLRKYVR